MVTIDKASKTRYVLFKTVYTGHHLNYLNYPFYSKVEKEDVTLFLTKCKSMKLHLLQSFTIFQYGSQLLNLQRTVLRLFGNFSFYISNSLV